MPSPSASPKSPTLRQLFKDSSTPVDTVRTWMLALKDDDPRKNLIRALLPEAVRDMCRSAREEHKLQLGKILDDIETGKLCKMVELYRAMPEHFRRSTAALASEGQRLSVREDEERRKATVTGQMARGF